MVECSFIMFYPKVDSLLQDKEKMETLIPHVDQFLVMCSLQLRLTHNKHMASTADGQDRIIKLYRCLLGSLLQVGLDCCGVCRAELCCKAIPEIRPPLS